MTSSWRARFTFDDVRGRSEALARVIWIGRRAAEGGYPTLIVGESGTGKELLAHGIHNASPLTRRPLRRDQLRHAPRRARGGGALRLRAGLVHRRRSPDARRHPRRRARRDAAPRRAAGHARDGAERAAPVSRDRDVRPRRRDAARAVERAGDRHAESRRRGGRAPRAGARRPALPPQLRHHRGAAASRAARGHPPDRGEVPARGAALPRRGRRAVLGSRRDVPVRLARETPAGCATSS